MWPEFGTNQIVHWEYGDEGSVEAKLKAAHTRVKVDLINNRLAPSPMEPRCVLATYDKADAMLTVYSPSQGGRRLQTMLAKNLLKMPMDKVRIVSRDTGGGFGVRSKMYPETVAVAFAARQLGRPVKWRGDRVETFMSDYHGRDQINHAEMGLDADGRIVALKLETLLNVGAYLSENGVRLPMEGGGRIIPGVYHVPDFYFSVRPLFTNTVCTDTYRGAGRPEANYITERLMDAAADACNLPREGDPPPQFRHPGADALCDASGLRARFGRLRRHDGHGDEGGALGTNGFGLAPQGSRSARQTSRHRSRNLHRRRGAAGRWKACACASRTMAMSA